MRKTPYLDRKRRERFAETARVLLPLLFVAGCAVILIAEFLYG